ncbi:galactonate dehydratase [Porphyrobacter sp. HT-58-2]|uniref:UxaA family hydrolase n=1 Tax=Porphyrobacter sp. HT-58-2 TaxID=2023229 RepID=UPI000CDC79DE|nr:altronate dehydratase family protein [Porphyrobacter sp. HT-58-2]AUX68908.1 galactonate dehydratase [Porphyrobacter sp. HT-58-2]
MGQARILAMHPDDNVALCLDPVAAGDALAGGVIAAETVPSGHKIALRPIAPGEAVRKYGQVIGLASAAIAPGAHVHVHNVSAEVGGMRSAAGSAPVPALPARRATFRGYRRASGKVGTRNYIGILTSVNCSANVARAIAAAFPDAMFHDGGAVDGVVALTHTTGCGMTPASEGTANLERTLQGYCAHPNFAAVLVVGLGCEMMQIAGFADAAEAARQSVTLRTLTIQDEGGTRAAIEAGRAMVRELIAEASTCQREEVSAEHLVLGLQCGGSDGWSGVTANPALGRAADLLVAAGGTVILSETPEIWGAEQLLFARAETPAVRAALQERLDWWADYVARNGAELNNNPSPGNIAGGLTTILEKSLGAVAKSGSSPLRGVYRYGEPIDRRGFVFMDSPGYDPCSATGQMAAGANILAFTTGRGSVFGSKPAPCIKLASNRALAERMAEDMDIDCSPVLDGVSLDAMGAAIFDLLLRTASGEKSKSEDLGLGDLEFVPWQMGAVM